MVRIRPRGRSEVVSVNNRWCGDVRVVGKYCSSNTEFLMNWIADLFIYRESSSTVFLLPVYTSPEAIRVTALEILHGVINRQETAHPDTLFIMAGDFNHWNLRNVLSMYHQKCASRQGRITCSPLCTAVWRMPTRLFPGHSTESLITFQCFSSQPTNSFLSEPLQ